MLHGLSNDFLYSAVKIETTFCDDLGKTKPREGTGFFILNNQNDVCLITNRHLVELDYERRDYSRYQLSKMIISGKRQAENSNLPEIDQAAEIPDAHDHLKFSANYKNDIACLIKPPIKPITDDGFRADYSIPYSFIADRERIATQLAICDFVAFPGYHPEHDKRNSRPILRTGTIASDPRFDHSYNDQDCGECIAYEAFSYQGASGSPIFAVQKGPRPGENISFPDFRELMMIGINGKHTENGIGIHKGISYMYKASAILDIVDQ